MILQYVLKELNESGIWLEMIVRSEMLPAHQVRPLAGECEELCKIMASSIKTAGKKSRYSGR